MIRTLITAGALLLATIAPTSASASQPGQGYKRNFNNGHVAGTKCEQKFYNHPAIDGKEFMVAETFRADASYYGNSFHNRNTMPSGNKLHECDATVAAYNSLPQGTVLRITRRISSPDIYSPKEVSVIVVIQDTGGPKVDERPDLARGAFEALKADGEPAEGVMKNLVFEVLVPTEE